MNDQKTVITTLMSYKLYFKTNSFKEEIKMGLKWQILMECTYHIQVDNVFTILPRKLKL